MSGMMGANLFQSTNVPLLEQVVSFTEARQTVLAGNIANIDTPGYQAHDLSVEEFQARLKAAVEEQNQPSTLSPGDPSWQPATPLAEVAKSSASMLRHDLGNVTMENQASEMAKNQMQHHLALTLLVDQFRQLQTAISEKV